MRRLFFLLVLMLTPSVCFAQVNAHMLSGVNAQIGTSYTMQAADQIKLTTFNNASPVAVTLPAATTPNFGAGTLFSVRNLGAGLVTITTPPGTLIDNGPNLLLTQGQGADIYSDGTNYISQKGAGTASLTGMTSTQVPIAATATTVASSKAIQGAADTGILGAGTVSGVSSPLCTDSNGGATTVGCPSGGGAPGGSPVQAQFNNSSSFGGSSCVNLTTFPTGPTNLDCDTHPIGPNPTTDITRYGARFVTVLPSANATCTSGSNQIVIATNTGNAFQVGDYIFAPGCGAANTMAAAPTPTVISGSSKTQTVPDAPIISTAGTSSYSYLLVSKDFNGGLTLPGTATTISNGVPIGQQTATVSSVTSTGQTLTISLGSVGPANGSFFHLTYIAQGAGQTNHKFDGYYNVCSGGGTTTITVCNMPFWSNTTDATAASIIWFNGNQLTWTNQATGGAVFAQYICGKRPGDVVFHFLGSSIPASGGNATRTTWDDWGNTLVPTGTTEFPEGNDAICVAASPTSDYLDNIKITACSPTTCASGSTLTIGANAGTTKSSFIQKDDAPALTAANAAFVNAGVGITIPCPPNTSTFLAFLSPQYLTSVRNWIDLCGSVNVNETIDLGNQLANVSMPLIGRSPTQVNSTGGAISFNAYPAINNASIVRNMSIHDQGNVGLGIIEGSGNSNQTIMVDHVEFQGGNSTIGLMTLGIFPFGYVTNVNSTLGPSNAPANYDTTWIPWFYADNCGELYMRNSYNFSRGFFCNNTNAAGPSLLDLDQYYIQGALMPMIGIFGGQGTSTSLNSHGLVNDTSPQPDFDFQTDPASPAAHFIMRTKDETGLPVNVISGWSPDQIWNEFGYANLPGFPIPSNVYPDQITLYGRLALQTSTHPDNFNRANGGLGSNWTTTVGSLSITNNQVFGGTAAAWNAAYYSGGITPLQGATSGQIQFCSVTATAYNGGNVGCAIFMNGGFIGGTSPGSNYLCDTNGSVIELRIGGTQINQSSYTGGGPGDTIYATYNTGTWICTVYPVNGNPLTITANNTSSSTVGNPGLLVFGNAAIADNFSGGTLNPIVYPTAENAYTAPQHLVSGTVGTAAPIPGPLPDGYWSVVNLQALGWSAADGLNSAYDGFNRANGGLGTNWTTLPSSTAPTITSNQVLGNTASVHQVAEYTATTFSADQFSEFTAPVGGNSATGAIAPVCRASLTTQTYYSFQFFNGSWQLLKVVAGAFTALSSTVSATLLSGDVARIECVGQTITGFQISGGVKTQIAQATDNVIPGGNPGFDVFGNVAQSVIDNWSGGNVNTLEQPTVETDVLTTRHFLNAITIGIAAPVSGSLGPGIYNTLWAPSSSVCTDTNSKLVTSGCAGGSLSGMTAGQVAIAGSASTITSSKPLQGTDTNVLTSSTVATGTGNPLCTDTGSGATTTGCPNLSGMTSGQVAIAGSAITVTSSKALQGTDTSVLSSGTVSGTGATLCTDANGGATTVGCTGGSISGLTAGQIPVAGTATTITSSKPQQGTDANILTSGTISTTTPALLCTDANSGATTSNCSVYNTQSATTNTNIAATNMVASAPANTMYIYMWTISLTTVGTGCGSTTSVVLNVIFTDPSAAGSVTESLGQISIAPGGNGTLGFVAQGNDTVYAKSGTAVQYSTSGYTPGTGCTVNPSYQVTMRLIPIS